MTAIEQAITDFDESAERVVELGNRILDNNEETDEWEVASGILAGAIQFWLYSRQPCGDPTCESCTEISTAEQRMHQLLEEARQYAEESDYFHSPHDSNVGRA